MNFDLFGSDENHEMGLKRYVENRNMKGMLSYLNSLSYDQLREEALKAGFSMISFQGGKQKAVQHIFNQIN